MVIFQRLTIFTLILLTTINVAMAKSARSGAFLFDSGKKHLENILSHKDLIVDHVGSTGYEVYGPLGLHKYLDQLGADYIDLAEDEKQGPIFTSYPTPEEIGEKLKKLARENKDIIHLFSLGKSIEGRDLWTVKISDNVDLDEVEPEFKYVANMHGNEIVGRELMVILIHDLVASYRAGDAQVVELVNNTEIFIMPTLNPDGSAKKRRGNARWTDLNRDYPDFTTDTNPSPEGRQPETMAMMRFQADRHFSLSANFHGGTEVVNYPWDTSPETAPLTDLIIDLSKEYANFVPGMRNSREFDGGITNGYKWYEVNGGMQDWSYHWYGDLQVTIELSHNKWPDYNSIKSYYENNRPALLQYMQRVHQGAGFTLSKSEKGKIQVLRVLGSGQQKEVGTYGLEGSEYYKILPVGSYLFKVELNDSSKHEFATNTHPERIAPNGHYFNIPGL